MIPKIIHYAWLGDSQKKPIDMIESWGRILPGWEIKEWNETNLDLDRYSFSRIAYDLGSYGPALDLLRVDILIEQGGVWLDTDVVVHESLEPFLNYSFFIGHCDKSSFNIGTIGAEAGHPLLFRVQNWYLEHQVTLEGVSKEWLTDLIFYKFNTSLALLGALKVLYGFIPTGRPQTLDADIRIESAPVFTIRGNYGVKNYAEHLYEGSWRNKFDWAGMSRAAYETDTISDTGPKMTRKKL